MKINSINSLRFVLILVFVIQGHSVIGQVAPEAMPKIPNQDAGREFRLTVQIINFTTDHKDLQRAAEELKSAVEEWGRTEGEKRIPKRAWTVVITPGGQPHTLLVTAMRRAFIKNKTTGDITFLDDKESRDVSVNEFNWKARTVSAFGEIMCRNLPVVDAPVRGKPNNTKQARKDTV